MTVTCAPQHALAHSQFSTAQAVVAELRALASSSANADDVADAHLSSVQV